MFFEGNRCPWQRSKELDRFFGYKISKIEQRLVKKYRSFNKPTDASNRKKHFVGSQVWVGLNPQALQTPYIDLYWILNSLCSQAILKIVDLGAGYGRIGLVSKMIFPEAEFIGVEILKDRYSEACRIFEKFDLPKCSMLNRNLMDPDFAIPEADLYFIYDFSHTDEINFAISYICRRNSKCARFFIAAIGERVNFLIGKSGSFFGNWELVAFKNDIRIFCISTTPKDDVSLHTIK